MHRFAQVTAVATFILLIAGGLVTSTDSGLSVPDWPLSYGTWLPPMVGGIRYEHTHRVIAGLVACLIAGLAVWLHRREPRRWVRRLGSAAVGGVFLQALLGGLTVLLVLPPPVSIAHACLGQIVFCLVVCIAWATSPAWPFLPPRPTHMRSFSLRVLSILAAGACFLQLFLGAMLRHTGRALVWHMANAVLVLGVTAWLAVCAWRRCRVIPPLRRLSWGLLLGVCAQLGLGVAALAHRDQALITTAHVGVGALLFAGACALAMTASAS